MEGNLEEHDYKIVYKPGKANVVADALSRIVCSMTGTQHSAEESDDLYIEATESPINIFKRQIILKEGIDKVTVSHHFPEYTRIEFPYQTLMKILFFRYSKNISIILELTDYLLLKI